MRLVTYRRRDGTAAVGVAGPRGVVDLAAAWPDGPRSVRSLVAAGPAGLVTASRLAERDHAPLADPAEAADLLPPVPDPTKVVCIGLNYRDHALETKAAIPREPVVFSKLPGALAGPHAPIELPADSDQVDYEAELVVVIGRRARRVAAAEAMAYVAGYLVGNDVSARDWQKNKDGKQWLLGKSFDTFAPTGPALVTADEVPDPHDLGIRFRLNGQVMQESRTGEMIFRIPELLAYVSRVATLEPGDLLFTGTPAGVGVARTPPVFLKPGDVCEAEIDGLGTLRNPCVAEPPPPG